MAHAPTAKKPNKPKPSSGNDSDPGPSAQERAASGIKLAEHVQKAMTGGKIRQAFALWGAAKQLRVAAAGSTGVIKKYPLAAAVIGGTLAGAAIYVAAKAAGASDAAEQEAGDEQANSEEGSDEETGDEETSDDRPADSRVSRNRR